MNQKQRFSLIMLSVFAAQPSAADSFPSDLQACMDLDDDVQRLDCFDDALSRNSTITQDVTRESAAPIHDDPPAEAVQLHVYGASSDKGTVEDDSFGLPANVASPIEKAEENQDSNEIIALVTSLSQRPRGEHIVVLDNGQVWAEEFASRYFPVKVGDAVTIKKRRFHGYLLVTESGKGFAVERLR